MEMEKVDESLIATIMGQIRKKNEQCGFWLISILSKAKAGDISVDHLLEIAEKHIPESVKEWNRYVKET